MVSTPIHRALPAVRLRKPSRRDGAAVWGLIRQAGTLDLNSAYCYVMLCDHFRDTCVLAENAAGEAVGFVSAYCIPGRADTLFVWQIAVAASHRGQGLALALLEQLCKQAAEQYGAARIRFIETTVSPSNMASRRLMAAFAARNNCGIEEMPGKGYEAGLFPDGHTHEDEPVLRLGPFA